eukprot:14043547-Ditylum_brightwellii.AAC.1
MIRELQRSTRKTKTKTSGDLNNASENEKAKILAGELESNSHVQECVGEGVVCHRHWPFTMGTAEVGAEYAFSTKGARVCQRHRTLKPQMNEHDLVQVQKRFRLVYNSASLLWK